MRLTTSSPVGDSGVLLGVTAGRQQLFVPAADKCKNHVPGHALHEKGLQRQVGVGTLVSSQERRALLVARINRGSTAGFVPPSVYV